MHPEKVAYLIPEHVEAYKHVPGSRATELRKDLDFGTLIGGQREVLFTLGSKQGPQWHVHSGMAEQFIPIEGRASVLLIIGTDNDVGPEILRYVLQPNDSLLVPPNTPHFICNEREESATVKALQTITAPGGQTITLDLKNAPIISASSSS